MLTDDDNWDALRLRLAEPEREEGEDMKGKQESGRWKGERVLID